jgi:hypothetical protein
MRTRKRKLGAKLVTLLTYFAQDYDLPQIVQETGIPYRTLERRVERLKDFMGARHPGGLVAKAHKKGYINIDKI